MGTRAPFRAGWIVLFALWAICWPFRVSGKDAEAEGAGPRLALLLRQPNAWRGEPIVRGAYGKAGAVLITDKHVVFLGREASHKPTSPARVVKTIEIGRRPSGVAFPDIGEASMATLSDDGEFVLVETLFCAGEYKDTEPNASLYDYCGKLLDRFNLPRMVESALSKDAHRIVKFDPRWEDVWPARPGPVPGATRIWFHSLRGHQGECYRPGGGIRRRSRIVGRTLAILASFQDRTRLVVFRDESLKWMTPVDRAPLAVEVSPTEDRIVVLSRPEEWAEREAVRIYDALGAIVLEHRDMHRSLRPTQAVFLPRVDTGQPVVVLDNSRAVCFDATDGRLLWDTWLPTIPRPASSLAEGLAFLPSGYVIASIVASDRQQQPREFLRRLSLLSPDGRLLDQLELPDVGRIWPREQVRGPNRFFEVLPDGKTFWIRDDYQDAYLVRVTHDAQAP